MFARLRQHPIGTNSFIIDKYAFEIFADATQPSHYLLRCAQRKIFTAKIFAIFDL
jgi:hypothetical protein